MTYATWQVVTSPGDDQLNIIFFSDNDQGTMPTDKFTDESWGNAKRLDELSNQLDNVYA